MKELDGRVAVVVGAASGIGRAVAERLADERMRLLVADVEEVPLEELRKELEERGTRVEAVPTDASSFGEVEALAVHAYERFGPVNVLVNAAGVTHPVNFCWDLTEADWQWVLGVNFGGVLNGIRAFVPRMIERGEEGHVVNVASMAGLLSAAFGAAYDASKHAIVSLSETLYHDLEFTQASIGVSVVCAGWTRTRILDAARNRPEPLRNPPSPERAPGLQMVDQAIRALIEQGQGPDEVADAIVDGILENRLYVLTHSRWKDLIRNRAQNIVEQRNPVRDPLPLELGRNR